MHLHRLALPLLLPIALTACSARAPRPASVPTTAADAAPPGQGAHSYAANRRAAEAEAVRVLGLAPMPDGAVERPRSDADRAFDMIRIGPSDDSITKSKWFSVPLGPDQLEKYLLGNVPARFQV